MSRYNLIFIPSSSLSTKWINEQYETRVRRALSKLISKDTLVVSSGDKKTDNIAYYKISKMMRLSGDSHRVFQDKLKASPPLITNSGLYQLATDIYKGEDVTNLIFLLCDNLFNRVRSECINQYWVVTQKGAVHPDHSVKIGGYSLNIFYLSAWSESQLTMLSDKE